MLTSKGSRVTLGSVLYVSMDMYQFEPGVASNVLWQPYGKRNSQMNATMEMETLVRVDIALLQHRQ